MHNRFDRNSDTELMEMAAAARKKAHNAPKCISGIEEQPYCSGNTFAIRTGEWMEIEDELDRRKHSAPSVHSASSAGEHKLASDPGLRKER